MQALSLALLALPQVAMASSEGHAETLHIFGGVPTETCEWPTTVGFGHCTGTLVHPQVVLTAGHCGSPRQIYFGERYKGGVAKTVTPKFCMKNPSYTGKPGLGGDSHFCVLNEPVKDVPIAPIAFGCEVEEIKAGAKIWLVGFGKANGATAGSGVKHKVEVPINRVNKAAGELNVGGGGKATCYGDSGGPAFMKMSDGTWRTVGITSYGTSSQCGYPSGLTMASSAVKWIQKAIKDRGLDIDLQPCYDDDGNWAPTSECGGFATSPGKAFGNWSNMCSKGAPRSGASSICGAKNGDAGSKEKAKPKSKPVTIKWGEEVGPKIKSQEGEAVSLSVRLGGPDDKVDHLVLVVDGDREIEAEPEEEWELDDFREGSYNLVAQARDEDEKVLAKTKSIKLVVSEAEESSQEEEDSENGASEEGSEIEDSEQEGASGGGKDRDKASNDEDDKDQGCSMRSSSSSLWMLFGLGLVLVRRRRDVL